MESASRKFVLSAMVFTFFLTGCAEGPLWRSGHYVPWARNKWAAEEKLADTTFARKRRMDESVREVLLQPAEQQEPVAASLFETAMMDPILLVRLHAVKLLGELKCPTAQDALSKSAADPSSEVRIAAVKAMEKLPANFSIPELQNVIGSDTNVDVRMAATRVLGNFPGQQTMEALAMALEDNDPALQIRAAESLQRITGESLGGDVVAWRNYVQSALPASNSLEQPVTNPLEEPVSNAMDQISRTAEANDFEIRRR